MATHKASSNSAVRARPLDGRRIVVTRARSQGVDFARKIEELGGDATVFPTIEIVPPRSYEPLDRAIREIGSYEWIIFTSVNGVEHFWARFQALKQDIRLLSGIRVAAIGPRTAEALAQAGIKADVVPEEYRAEEILAELKPDEVHAKRVLLPRAAGARDVLPKTLAEWGAEVDEIEAYRTIGANGDTSGLRAELLAEKVDMVTFTSSSTVSHFAALFPEDAVGELLARTAVACIGPITQKTAEDNGIRVDVVAREYTIAGLTQAIVEYFSKLSADS